MLQDNCRFRAALRGRQSTEKAAQPKLGHLSRHPPHQHPSALMSSQVPSPSTLLLPHLLNAVLLVSALFVLPC